jgi:methanogenic corrinoid protein MtbC1
MDDIEKNIDAFEQALLSVNRPAARNALIESIGAFGKDAVTDLVITSALDRIGKKWESGHAALSQVYMSGIICEELIDLLFPQKNASLTYTLPVAVVTFEDYHVLGKRIVKSVLKSAGFNVLDYGHGICAEELIKKVRQDGAPILLISTLMFPSALHVKKIRTLLDESGLHVKIGVGGAPFRFDDNLWKQVGADAMGKTASDAIRIARKMTEELS